MKPPGASARLTIDSQDPAFAVDVGDAVITKTKRVYLVVAARRVRTARAPAVWAVQTIVAEWPPPPGARIIGLTWWRRAPAR